MGCFLGCFGRERRSQPQRQLRKEDAKTSSQSSSSEDDNTKNNDMMQDGDSQVLKAQLPHRDPVEVSESIINAGDGSGFINSVLNPVENVTPRKPAKHKPREAQLVKPQKENLASNFEASRVSLSSELPPGQSPLIFKKRSHQLKSAKQEISVDASLSSWSASPEIKPSRKSSLSGFETMSSGRPTDGCTYLRSYEDRQILGALTLDGRRQISKPSPWKSPSRCPDDMPIIGTVGSYWTDSSSARHSGSPSSVNGIPNTTSKYKEDRAVNWHSTPFETRLDRALRRGRLLKHKLIMEDSF